MELAHGEAVAIGLIFAAELALELGRIDADRVDEHRRIVAWEYGLRITPPERLDVGELLDLMAHDKKALDGLTFVLDGTEGMLIEVRQGNAPGIENYGVGERVRVRWNPHSTTVLAD